MKNSAYQRQVLLSDNKAIAREMESKVESLTYRCPQCGTTFSEGDRFCNECGTQLNNNSCRKCGAIVEYNMEICPECGDNLLTKTCSFCGANIKSQDIYCPECGNPREGIVCKKCNTLNYRSFCRKCNTPLNNLAQQAMMLAKNDPLVNKSYILIGELMEFEKYFEKSEYGKHLSEEDIALANHCKELLGMFRKDKPEYNNISHKENVESNKNKLSLSINSLSKEEAIKIYKDKLAEIQETLSSMLPDINMTPQMQRDFYSARKVEIEILTRSKIRLGWRCNAYGCMHTQPNECTKPFKGGKWIYEERDVITKQWKHL